MCLLSYIHYNLRSCLNYVLTLQVGFRSQLTFGQLQFLQPVILSQNKHRQQNPHSLECRFITMVSFKAIVKTTLLSLTSLSTTDYVGGCFFLGFKENVGVVQRTDTGIA